MLRIGGDQGRPLLRDPELPAIFRRRVPSYEAVATHIVATGGRSPEAVCLDVIGRLAQVPSARPGTAPG
jgi:shikimate kinase